MKETLKLVLLWAALSVMVYIICTITFSPIEKFDILTARGLPVEAIVEKKEPYDHQHITYSYIVDGNRYTDIGAADHGNPSFDDIKLGQKITAYYDPTDPQVSTAGDPKSYVNGNPGGIYFLTIFGPPLIIFGLYRRGWI